MDKCGFTPANAQRVRALMLLQRWSGLALVDAVCLRRDELTQGNAGFHIDTARHKSGVRVQVPIPTWLGKELLLVKNGNEFFFQTGEATPKSAVSIYDKLYRKVFATAGIHNGSSHRLRHRFAVGLLERGVDIRTVSKCLGHKSLATERYYSRWNTAQQSSLDSAVMRTWK